MIAVNELRVGNWVYSSAIKSNIQVVPWNFTSLVIWQERGESIYEPIPLTPEILEKAGFVIIMDGIYEFSKDVFLFENVVEKFRGNRNIYTIGAGYHFTETRIISCATIQYLHQLQNLYFPLTGEELKINL